MNPRVEHGDLDRWVLTLDEAVSAAPDEAAKVVEKGALNIKDGWRRRWSGHAHAPALPNAVTYDTYRGLRGPGAEIGPDKDKRQGDLGNLFEYGSVNNAPIPGGAPSVAEELPRYEQAMEDLSVRLLEGR